MRARLAAARAAEGGAAMAVVDFSHVRMIDFSCADEVIAKLVLPGQKMDGASIYQQIEEEGVTFSAAVPTVTTRGVLVSSRPAADSASPRPCTAARTVSTNRASSRSRHAPNSSSFEP